MEQTIQKPLSSEEAAEYLGYSKNYLFKLVHEKKIPYHKPLNGRLFFKLDELKKFVFGQEA